MDNTDFIFKKIYTKTTALIQDIETVKNQCNAYDKMEHHFFIDEDYQDYSDVPCAYLAVYNGDTIGFLCPYVIDKYNVEFCVFVLPPFRRQKVASELFFRMVINFEQYSYRSSILPENLSGKQFLERMGFTYGCRECSMKLSKKDYIPLPTNMELSIVKQDDKLLISGFIDSIEVGHLEITAYDMCACIHDVEVKEHLRRNGYGYGLLASALNDIFEKYEYVLLHVTKENKPAFALYKKIGFQTLEELDYYEL